jgi:hypothetical protein
MTTAVTDRAVHAPRQLRSCLIFDVRQYQDQRSEIGKAISLK